MKKKNVITKVKKILIEAIDDTLDVGFKMAIVK